MPSYRATEPGFFGGALYAPDSKREIVTTEKPLKPVPSWLKPIGETKETAAERKAREAAEAAALKAKKAEDEKAAKDVDFTNGANGSKVETLK